MLSSFIELAAVNNALQCVPIATLQGFHHLLIAGKCQHLFAITGICNHYSCFGVGTIGVKIDLRAHVIYLPSRIVVCDFVAIGRCGLCTATSYYATPVESEEDKSYGSVRFNIATGDRTRSSLYLLGTKKYDGFEAAIPIKPDKSLVFSFHDNTVYSRTIAPIAESMLLLSWRTGAQAPERGVDRVH